MRSLVVLTLALVTTVGCEDCVNRPQPDAGTEGEGEGEGGEGEGEGEGEGGDSIITFCELLEDCNLMDINDCIAAESGFVAELRSRNIPACTEASVIYLSILDCRATLSCLEVLDPQAIGENCGEQATAFLEQMDICEPPPCTDEDPGVGDQCRAESVCGDLDIGDTEGCDDGNIENGDGCSSVCLSESCGNGVEEPGPPFNEECDDGNQLNGSPCDAICQDSSCGDGEEDQGEECDDGNLDDADGCTRFCKLECGFRVCDPQSGGIICNDPGLNDCGACGPIDTAEGRLGEACGEFLCGIAICDPENPNRTLCEGDHPRNSCGGCGTLPVGLEPGDTCSGCATGTQTCTVDLDNLVCYRGREPTNECGCAGGRCVQFHAFMEDVNPEAGYVLPGTTALIEDVDDSGNFRLTFDPLFLGPGGCCLPDASVFLASGLDPAGFLINQQPLSPPPFASTLSGEPADPVRFWDFDESLLIGRTFIVLSDDSGLFLDPILAVGEIVPGAPPE